MIQYWVTAQDEKLNMYSVDMVRVTFKLADANLEKVMAYFGNPYRTDITDYYPCTKEFKYKYLYTIEYGNSATMTIGLCFNGTTKGEMLKGFIEVNPNKCFNYPLCIADVYYTLLSCYSYEIARWDLAIDIPTDRMSVVLEKDQRKYAYECKSREDKTEYLGCRNEVGRVKVYNKTAESKLNYTITRCEITLPNPDSADFYARLDKLMPTVWVAGTESGLELSNLSSKDALLLRLLREQENPMMLLKEIDYVQRKKLEPYVIDGYTRLDIQNNCIKYIIAELHDFFKCEDMYGRMTTYRKIVNNDFFKCE